jgi:hypothetical protein
VVDDDRGGGEEDVQRGHRHQPQPLTDLERLLVLSAMGGTTGWHYSITRNAHYAGHMANYAAGAAGRTFPSAAGFHTSELFFTDDSGTYMFPTRDAGALIDPADEDVTVERMLERHESLIVKLDDRRIEFPREEPYYEGHNTWCVNLPGSLLAFPVGDLAQHTIAGIMFLTQNGYCLGDDVNGRPIPGMEKFRGLVDVDDTTVIVGLRDTGGPGGGARRDHRRGDDRIGRGQHGAEHEEEPRAGSGPGQSEPGGGSHRVDDCEAEGDVPQR